MRLDCLRDKELALRLVEPEDAQLLHSWENDPFLAESNSLYEPLARYQAQQFVQLGNSHLIENGSLMLIAEVKLPGEETPTPIGYVELYNYDHFHRRVAVGLVVLPSWQHQGYGRRMLSCIEHYSFDLLRLHQLYAEVVGDNAKAMSFFDQSHYKRVARLPQWQWQHGAYQDLIIYQLCPE